MSYSLEVKVYAASHKGLVRKNNEDNFYINGRYLLDDEREGFPVLDTDCTRSSQLYAVCDGMGGEAFGELASLKVVQAMQKLDSYLATEYGSEPENKPALISDFVTDTNDEICELIRLKDNIRMGSTISALHVFENKAVTINIGDSRVYLFRDNELKQLTKDHTEAESLIEAGAITAEQAKKHESKRKLTKHFGVKPEEETLIPDICSEIEVHEGDIFVLCSDGLADMISEEEFSRILSDKSNSGEIHTLLIKSALAAGGEDNITAVVVKVAKLEEVASRINRKGISKPIVKDTAKKQLDPVMVVAPVLIIAALILSVFAWRFIIYSINSSESAKGTSKQVVKEEAEAPKDSDQEQGSLETSDEAKDQEQTPAIPADYRIQKGDNLSKISEKFYGNKSMVKAIMALNGIKDANNILVGQVIKLPEPGVDYSSMIEANSATADTNSSTSQPTELPEEYIIKTGDSLYKISEYFYKDTSMVSSIMELNGLANPNSVFAGQKIKLPKEKLTTPAPSPGGTTASGDNKKESTEIPEQYKILAGENLYKISERFYGSTSMVKAIMELNEMTDANKVFAGQVIKLPPKR